ncbi:VOC family protein [Roseitranquillus sediminis]|uniref:VOC family protein n=1 Tax=Roseitranquillus sediminis TaxID=2809051 RepID=UPI001D0C1DBC|nr:VOC family protein [Roseitranquillus sediminis]MBM9593737.1 lactoylglutathione lyase [Roseitranquillus sediminis]
MADAERAESVFINLPVGDVARSQAFFESLGFEADPRFSAEDRAACIVLSGTVSAMLLSRETFGAVSPKPVANTATMSAVLTCLRVDGRERIDRIMDAALESGATESRPPRDQERVYSRAFEDPDGNVWELLWVDGDA